MIHISNTAFPQAINAGSLLSHRKLTIFRNKYILNATCNGMHVYKSSSDGFVRQKRKGKILAGGQRNAYVEVFYTRGMNLKKKKKYFQL